MLPYQEKYIENAKEIAGMSSFFSIRSADGFDAWYREWQAAAAHKAALKEENIALLNRHLFPALDELPGASAEDIAQLEAFADRLMDWKNNLDIGVYVAIHDALLSLSRLRGDRSSVIRQLYLLGMGLYYQGRMLSGVEGPGQAACLFQNEMVFTEAGSYIRYFEEIGDEATQGYIIRALANVALCAQGHPRKIDATARALRIIRDPHYRQLAPGLPWDVFMRRCHQQMSIYRSGLAQEDLSREQVAAVLDSCYEVFKPENSAENPSIRWLWPYYDMEFNCGLVDLKTTLNRLETMIRQTAYDQYDLSGLYGNVQLALYYGRMLRDHPALQKEPDRVRFLDRAYRKMQKTLLTCPVEQMDDNFAYTLVMVISGYFEMEGVLPYRQLIIPLMQRFAGETYIDSRRAGDMLRAWCAAIYRQAPGFFDDIPFLRDLSDPGEKERALLDYAENCGLLRDIGLVKMNISRTLQTRHLFETEYQMYQLHTWSGHDDLAQQPSTREYADVALGHHRWYNGAGGYPAEYERTASPCRQMTDVAAVVTYMLEKRDSLTMGQLLHDIFAQEGKRFSPMVTAFLNDEALIGELDRLLHSDGRAYYQSVYTTLTGQEAETP